METLTTQCLASTSALCSVQFEPVGRWFEACRRRQRHDRSVSMAETKDAPLEDVEDDLEQLTEDDKQFMISLDAREWKKQDHYRVLGLSKLRVKATEEDIRKAFKKKVLRHHPDKKSAEASVKFHVPGLNEHEFFTCITTAFEVLGDPKKRRSYDSVDEAFDNKVPPVTSTSKERFYETFGPAFTRNSCWSVKEPVPLLGNEKNAKEDVEKFYNFWYNFESWREFSYLDEEEKDKAENRDERRWMEKQNRQARQKRKKEEIARIRLLVDNAYTCDPRIKRFKELEKKRKQIEKQVKEEAARRAEEERQQAQLAEKLQREEEEKQADERALQLKKEKEKIKKAKAKDRKIIRQKMKDFNYLITDGGDVMSAISMMESVLENMSLESLQELRHVCSENDTTKVATAYNKEVSRVKEELEAAEKQKKELLAKQAEKYNETSKTDGVTLANKPWSEVEMQLLVKATTLFPVGTSSRWQVIANYVNEHSGSKNERTSKQVISKVKELQKLDPAIKKEMDKKAFERLEKQTSAKGVSVTAPADSNADSQTEKPWSSNEQQLLEQALKSYPQGTPERWEKIAASIQGRTKRECMVRYKELVEMVKAKRQALAQAKGGK